MIYFVHCARTGLTKIGLAGSVDRVLERLRDFQASSATRLRIVSLIDGDRAAERALHDEHRDRRVHGEWFRDVVPPPTLHDLAQFPNDLCARKAIALVDAAQPFPRCACGAEIRRRESRYRRCSPCAAAHAEVAAAAARARCDKRRAERAQREATRERALAEKRAARSKPVRGYVSDGVTAMSKRVAAEIGLSGWQTAYTVLRTGRPHPRGDEIRAAAAAAGWRTA